ncbi:MULTISPECIES: DUF1772 domain-containing protein [unclassified Rhodococcus (in: high G+C Gram-positive bacteria)]|uniref:anthrone oxygenase family protein n=1 Tax=unclassified Rhodococcus (in: high G+C Gram-positive bacteria) TaxID=192944 RepID=UPI00163B23F7|nr:MULTISPECIES: anthrone oxygenase family protein [unclassified Rhodococcus (in: high G+C Gram-positive bacteria)]MBC2641371.1 DUF1772 domain-containing protein [Rhodococcus sp. 3A]MBC2893884.1 DUF1772 domain-containing protein [Rhodococcus sp. 4CII]
MERYLTVVTAVSAGVVGGVMFAFSTFIMSGLGRLEPAQGIAAMQAINREAPNFWFMTALFGTALTSIALAVVSVVRHDGSAVYAVTACALYLVGIVLTIVYHVPHNNALDALDPTAADSAAYWRDYLSGWTGWNHVRTVSAMAASAVLTWSATRS